MRGEERRGRTPRPSGPAPENQASKIRVCVVGKTAGAAQAAPAVVYVVAPVVPW